MRPDETRAGAAGRTWRHRARQRWQRLAAGFRRIAGMPDYGAYVAHLRARHPECRVPSEREFFEQYLRFRYEGGPTRCC